MSLQAIAQLLKDTIGLDVASVGESAIARAAKERQVACRLADPGAYLERVRASATELQELIEAVVVPETWFFRDREAFAALAREAAAVWLQTHADGVFRLLSVPCATGEEPYSIAMALIENGFPLDRFRIDAVDVSERALAHGRRAVYGRGAFRGGDVGFRDRCFQTVANGHQLAEAVRQQVAFHHGNLLSSTFAMDREPYDVIFCRNLLIYFDGPTQDRAIAALARLLAPRGFLFVGASETGVLLNHGFASAKLPMAFAFRRASETPRRESVAVHAQMAPAVVVRPAPRPAPRPAAPALQPSVVRTQSTHDASTGRPDGIAEAQRLADQGRFVEAATACEACLRRQGPSASAFYLLGLVRDASGNHADAETYYRKTLYLDPNHRETLVHLALLMDTQGRQADALVLHNRVRRLTAADQS
jgi:chemotaxis protein methyltransferase WspC